VIIGVSFGFPWGLIVTPANRALTHLRPDRRRLEMPLPNRFDSRGVSNDPIARLYRLESRCAFQIPAQARILATNVYRRDHHDQVTPQDPSA
jgi:hypothetical protein